MIIFNSAHGKYELASQLSDLTILEFLQNKKIPVNAVSLYGQFADDETLHLVVGMDQKLSNLLNKYENLIIQPDRNIDFQAVLNRDIAVHKIEEGQAVGEYLTDTLNEEDSIQLDRYTVDSATEYVNEAVGKVLNEEDIDFTKKIVFGISGGGDSNTLLDAFIANGFPKENLIPVMIHGIPDMDQGTERARVISEEHGLKLIELSPEEINKLLGRKVSETTWAEDYEEIFNDDLESIATLVIRLGLSQVARDNDAQAIVTGLNLEDLLGEALFAVAKGVQPLAFPTRMIDGVRVIYPLYRVPKKIIDATHPNFSLENYIQRFPSNSHWRAIMYYFAQSISSTVPGMEFRLIDGFKKISKQPELHIDEHTGLPAMGELDEETVKLWNKFING